MEYPAGRSADPRRMNPSITDRALRAFIGYASRENGLDRAALSIQDETMSRVMNEHVLIEESQ